MKYILLAIFFFAPLSASAADYVIAPEKSAIAFEAKQEGKAITGGFKTFGGTISFDPANLAGSNAKVWIETASIFASSQDANTSLKETEWFDVSKFPRALFETTTIKSIGANKYIAEGTLTIKSTKVPVAVNFTVLEYTPKSATAEGELTLSRKRFKLGWEDTNSIKDEVKVLFKVQAGA